METAESQPAEQPEKDAAELATAIVFTADAEVIPGGAQ